MNRKELYSKIIPLGILAGCLLGLTGSAGFREKTREDSFNPTGSKSEPSGWFAGDIHVHRSCDGSTPLPSGELKNRMKENDLAVISVLGDMGNSESPHRIEDLLKVSGKDDPVSDPDRIIHYSAEWNWDADSRESAHQTHTAPIYITVRNQPIRASAADAEFFVRWIDNILDKIAPGEVWSPYYSQHREEMIERYRRAREIYAVISS